MLCNFSFKHYKECLELAKSKKYTFFSFSDYEISKSYKKIVFMRHDIDIQIDNALRMASIENELGIKSTFFIRLCGNYNIFNLKILRKLNKLLEMSHEIGFHFEPDFSILNNRDILKDLKFQKNILENLLSIKIVSIAPHEPVRTGHIVFDENVLKKIGIKYQAYSDMFFKKLKYISDSSCHWRDGCMHKFFEKEVPRLCILTHPFWWYEKSPIENY